MLLPKVLVIIVNYRTADLTIQCLHSLMKEITPDIHVYVVDNNSSDQSAEKIQAAIHDNRWENWATCLPLDTNGGFAFGNNAAIRIALKQSKPPHYFLLLNPDTIVLKGAIQALLEFMESHPKAGIVGSWLEGLDKQPQVAAFRFPTIFSEIDNGLRLGVVSKLLKKWNVSMEISEEPHRAEWVAGASFMVRKEVFEDIGLLDENYFLYYEELDFCKQSHKAGWECWFVPTSKVIHLVGQSTQVSNPHTQHKRRPKYWFESRRRYFQKNHGFFYTLIADSAWMISFMLWRLRRVIQRKPDTDPPDLLRDFFKNSSFFQGHKGHKGPKGP